MSRVFALVPRIWSSFRRAALALPRRAVLVPFVLSGSLGAVLAGCRSCEGVRNELGPLGSHGSHDGANATAPAAFSPGSSPGRVRRDDAGHLLPRSSPSPAPANAPPRPSREPDWDLDAGDAARDYVRRYVLGTKRYGETLDCIAIGPSAPADNQRRVEVRVEPGCPRTGRLRDVFLVDVAADRLTVDDKSKRDPLARWPDGSDPEGPAGGVRQVEDLRRWSGPLADAFRQKLLVPIRVQGYGRGTYPVVTIAGWHGEVSPSTSADELSSLAEELCKANRGAPLGVFAGIDRSRVLRIRCPVSVANVANARWDRL